MGAGGLGLVGACDIAVAGHSSTFALTEARIGVAPSIISLTLLPKMSARAAGRYFVTGEKFGAAAAAAIGLITVAADDVTATSPSWIGDRLGSPQGRRIEGVDDGSHPRRLRSPRREIDPTLGGAVHFRTRPEKECWPSCRSARRDGPVDDR